MNCPLCGDVCSCLPEPSPTPSPRWMPDAGDQTAIEEPHLLDSGLRDRDESALPENAPTESEVQAGDGAGWRDELSARLDRYRARRKPRPPRYPSLRLTFDAPSRPATSSAVSRSTPEFETASNQALALNGLTDMSSPTHEEALASQPAAAHTAQVTAPLPSRPPTYSTAKVVTGKILEFPRFAPPTTSPDELAEAITDRPRILEAAEVTPPPPALGGITIEAIQQAEIEKRPGIDVPLQSAPLARRIVAAAVDGFMVAAASALFGFIFWKVAAVRPPRFQIRGLAAGVPCLFWVAYQYLLLVYSASTPGLRLAGLQLARFDGTRTNRSLRRWRVLGSCLSAISLGMGYAWVFLDEDALCWHDRITHTFLAPRRCTATGTNNASV
jgi:hypothetical protein